MGREDMRTEVDRLAHAVTVHLDAVLAESGLTSEQVARYRSVVAENVETLGV